MDHSIVLVGASGLIGTALARALRARGSTVRRLVRVPPASSDLPFADEAVLWDPSTRLDPALIEGAQAVISLGGASIARLPWTARYRNTLWDSRVHTTRTITNAVRELGGSAPALLSASGIGFYGSAPGAALTESSPLGSTFLARLCEAWEREARVAEDHTRVALLRTAPVIHPEGVLAPMIRLTKLGLGGPLGTGEQSWPWISLADEVAGILHVLDHDISGPVNLTGPEHATQNTIGHALATALHRPYLLPAPEWALRLALGRDATESLLTTDADARPTVLEQTGYEFRIQRAAEAVHESLREATP